jgi:hypothetical protein
VPNQEIRCTAYNAGRQWRTRDIGACGTVIIRSDELLGGPIRPRALRQIHVLLNPVRDGLRVLKAVVFSPSNTYVSAARATFEFQKPAEKTPSANKANDPENFDFMNSRECQPLSLRSICETMTPR